MKRIAIFLDGTWNRPDADHPTNVLRLSRAVQGMDRDFVPQITLYQPGVGSGRGANRVARALDRTFGGAFGWGLLEIIEETYRQLIFLYEPGDELFIFGFSRGGFAARSLAGLIRSCGIPPRRHVARVPEAMDRYVSRKPETHPDDPTSWVWREDFAPNTATSDAELKWRRDRHPDSGAIALKIDYLGIWDTVKALGLPKFAHVTDRLKAKYAFHDAALSSSVLSARHAIAIDERRLLFPSLPWDNVADLNLRRRGAYLQQYFPGDHGSVGGGGSRIGLSSITLHWIAIGAQQAGLDLSWSEIDRLAWDFDPEAPLTNKVQSGGLLAALKADRPGPEDETALSLAAFDRYRRDGRYRPKTLDPLMDELFRDGADEHLRALMIERDGGPTHVPGQAARPRFEIARRRG